VRKTQNNNSYKRRKEQQNKPRAHCDVRHQSINICTFFYAPLTLSRARGATATQNAESNDINRMVQTKTAVSKQKRAYIYAKS
jgi:hypothetical protein